ncbi:hypothetical protein LJR039_000818 [Pseudorhodoferax sp. LjRoot39]|uniref:hypothetical protein n=1 Tax=Burkholderiales TaxID=80840 RepID=UPI00224B5E25|nr:hypothetical protein [Paucibacter sp. PLA-PC-4]MCX2865650.1 hypothetical protein [Paucibacter sp. PLA-PC-4]
MFAVTAVIASTMTLAPAPRTLGVGEPALPRSLVTACALAPGGVARQAPACPATVAVAAVTVTAQDDLSKTPRAQKQASGMIHAHLGEPKVLDGIARSGPHLCGTAFIGTV